jgi:hypothetical protein
VLFGGWVQVDLCYLGVLMGSGQILLGLCTKHEGRRT